MQKRLDTLAEKYQYNEEIGTARYKLYELQAFVHYFNGDTAEALDFIDQAIETHGGVYERAEKLRNQLLKGVNKAVSIEPEHMSKQERRQRYIGLEGWLALFVVGVCASILLGVINLLGYGSVFNDLSSASSTAADYVTAITPALWFEIVTNLIFVAIGVWLIILFAKHSRIAKIVAIIYLVGNALFLIVDYAWASSIFETFHVTQYVEAELHKASSNTGRAVLAALIWVPYFLLSKRVKATLTK